MNLLRSGCSNVSTLGNPSLSNKSVEQTVKESAQKVFAIGLSRTGAWTLTDVLALLGYRSHFLLIDDDLDAILTQFDAITHLPLVEKYQDLDQRFPGSKFILSIREKEDWLASCEYRIGMAVNVSNKTRELLQRIYGTETFDRKRFSETYDNYHEEVQQYFRGRKDALMIFDLCGGDGFAKLCPFLGKEIPAVAFLFNQENSRSHLEKPAKKIKRFLSQ